MIRVVHVASEVTPWSQTGGLGEVVGGLPRALVAADPSIQIAVISPLHRVTRERALARGDELEDTGIDIIVALPAADLVARLVRLASATPRLEHFFLDCPPLYDRDGVYGGPLGDHPDNALRFAFLARAAIAAAPHALGGPPDLFHAHDWQAGLVPVYLRRTGHPARSLLTVHNLLYQGVFDKEVVPDLGIGWPLFTQHILELYDRASFLKGGLAMADLVTTVSPGHAAEIQTPEGGQGLDGFLVHDVGRVAGILNGIDDESWDPARDPALAAPFHRDDLSGKEHCRADLCEEMQLEADDGDMVVGVVSRLIEQKGMDLVADLVPELHVLGVRLVVLGSGDPLLEDRFRWLAARFRRHLAVEIEFDPALARRIVAGCDAILMPSRFEPCGLTQMYAMRYGAVPIVNPVGGLGDTVDDPGDEALADGQGTGFAMSEPTIEGLADALGRAIALYQDPDAWQRLVRAGMSRDFSWRAPAARYLEAYRELVGPAQLRA